MILDWQLFLVGIVLVGALAYLAIEARRFFRPKTSCGGSCGCQSTPAGGKERKLVPLEALRLKSQSGPGMGPQPQ